jgi:hypothetical protein
MNEQELRSLVREAIERHLRPSEKRDRDSFSERRSVVPQQTGHASHIILNLLPGSQQDDGMCVIEPSVQCTHCGFCQSFGH